MLTTPCQNPRIVLEYSYPTANGIRFGVIWFRIDSVVVGVLLFSRKDVNP